MYFFEKEPEGAFTVDPGKIHSCWIMLDGEGFGLRNSYGSILRHSRIGMNGNFAFSPKVLPFAVPPFCCQGGWKAPSISSKEMMVMTVVGALVGLIRIK